MSTNFPVSHLTNLPVKQAQAFHLWSGLHVGLTSSVTMVLLRCPLLRTGLIYYRAARTEHKAHCQPQGGLSGAVSLHQSQPPSPVARPLHCGSQGSPAMPLRRCSTGVTSLAKTSLELIVRNPGDSLVQELVCVLPSPQEPPVWSPQTCFFFLETFF